MNANLNRDDIQCPDVGQSERTQVMKAEVDLHVKYRSTAVATVFSRSRTDTKQADDNEKEGSAGIESVMVDNAISNICHCLQSESLRVTELQQALNSHISALSIKVQQLEERRKKALKRSADIREEVDSVRRQICLLEGKNSLKTKLCTKLKNDILGLIKDNETKQRLIATKCLELHTLKSKLMGYTQKLEEYTTSIINTDTFDTIQTEIKQAEDRLAKLEEKKKHMEKNPEETGRVLSGAEENELKEKISLVNTESERMEEVLKQVQDRVNSVKAKQEQVKQATAVLHKRNAAQVLRLKRQVKERHLRHRQWKEQRQLLQQNVTSLTQQLSSEQ